LLLALGKKDSEKIKINNLTIRSETRNTPALYSQSHTKPPVMKGGDMNPPCPLILIQNLGHLVNFTREMKVRTAVFLPL
jgi:hypothetical protein